jgi:hypothetical protein
MAPEQLDAFLDAGKWSAVNEGADVYSLGLLLRELLTGKRPEAPDPRLPLARAIPDLHDRRVAAALGRVPDPAIPRPWSNHRRCTAHRPEDRYATASALSTDLMAFVERRKKMRKRIQRALVGVATALVVAGVVAGALKLRHDRQVEWEKEQAAAKLENDAKMARKLAEIEAAKLKGEADRKKQQKVQSLEGEAIKALHAGDWSMPRL